MRQIHQFPGGSIDGGRNVVGGEVSVSRNEQQWQINHQPQLFASAAASSGFPQAQTLRPQNWLQKNGIHPLMRPS